MNTVKSAGFFAYPLRVNVPSFGEWGFVLGVKRYMDVKKEIYKNFRQEFTTYLTRDLALGCFDMPKNFSCEKIETSTLLKPLILKYYDDKMWEIW